MVKSSLAHLEDNWTGEEARIAKSLVDKADNGPAGNLNRNTEK